MVRPLKRRRLVSKFGTDVIIASKIDFAIYFLAATENPDSQRSRTYYFELKDILQWLGATEE
jgi:hypothetical protein